MNYIGSKYSLLPEIENILSEQNVPAGGIALDLFAGSGAVAQCLKQRGHVVYANDWQEYAYVTNMALIALDELPMFERLLAAGPIPAGNAVESLNINGRRVLPADQPCARILSYLERLPGQDGAFYQAYCEGGAAGRLYYAQENGRRIQAIRDQIEAWNAAGLLMFEEKAWLVACLIEAADRVANTASVYGAYLKRVKATAHKPLRLAALQPIASPGPVSGHRVWRQDGLEVLDSLAADAPLRLVYVDPPYNHRQYAANYHILETIARWDLAEFAPRGVTGLRPAETQRSDFCIQSMVEKTFRRLFEQVNAEYLLFSYNNEGLLSEEKLLGLFEEFCTDVQFRRIRFKRFRADVDGTNRVYKADHTQEFLILGRPRRALSV